MSTRTKSAENPITRKIDAPACTRRAGAGCKPDAHMDVTDAMTGNVLGQVPRCTPADVPSAARRPRNVQKAWAARSVEERAAVLIRFHELMLDRQEEVLGLIQLENGKARRHAFEETGVALDGVDVTMAATYYAHTGRPAPSTAETSRACRIPQPASKRVSLCDLILTAQPPKP